MIKIFKYLSCYTLYNFQLYGFYFEMIKLNEINVF